MKHSPHYIARSWFLWQNFFSSGVYSYETFRSMTVEQRLHILSLREEWDDACQAYLAQEAADARYMEGLL